MRAFVFGLVVATGLVGCRDIADKKEADVVLSPECAAYLEKAQTCLSNATEKAMPAVSAIYRANKKTIDAADTQQKMDALKEPCEKWTEYAGKNPACK